MTRSLPLAALFLLGCESADPAATPPTPQTDAATTCAPDESLTPAPANPTCTKAADDFVPGSATDGWPACISDDGAYHTFEASVSSLTRVEAFERIASVLGFGTAKVPTPRDFVEARALYSADEGIASRVVRREDEHYPPASKLCRDMTADEIAANRDRCAGPAKILPILTKAFTDGANGVEPAANAARIEAALLWFFYLSTYKESRTCAAAAKDCDSMWAKYTGGAPRTEGKGLSRYVRARSVAAHEAIFDGVLAVRCWRDLDNPTGAATNTTMHDRATAQLDRALLRGLALIVRQRAQQASCGAALEGVKVLAPVLDREATARDPSAAGAFLSGDPGRLVAEVDRLFACP